MFLPLVSGLPDEPSEKPTVITTPRRAWLPTWLKVGFGTAMLGFLGGRQWDNPAENISDIDPITQARADRLIADIQAQVLGQSPSGPTIVCYDRKEEVVCGDTRSVREVWDEWQNLQGSVFSTPETENVSQMLADLCTYQANQLTRETLRQMPSSKPNRICPNYFSSVTHWEEIMGQILTNARPFAQLNYAADPNLMKAFRDGVNTDKKYIERFFLSCASNLDMGTPEDKNNKTVTALCTQQTLNALRHIKAWQNTL